MIIGNNSIQEWKECRKFYHKIFWEEFDKERVRAAKEMLQAQIDEEFRMQIGAERYERADTRKGKRNGYYERVYETAAGRIEGLKIPRTRELDIRYSVFEQWERVQPKVMEAMLKAYLFGQSASCAQEIITAFGQSRFSRSYLQRLVTKFETDLKAFHQEPIRKAWPYIFIDGMHVKIREVDCFREYVVIFAIGMNETKEKKLLGWIVARTESEQAVRSLILNLKERGLEMPDLSITDGAEGILSALRLEYPHVPHQLCSFHKIKNIESHLKDIKHRKQIMREAGDIYQHSHTRRAAILRYRVWQKRWKNKEPEAVKLFSRNFESTLTYFQFPKLLWPSLRTSNPIEQFISKLRTWLDRYTYFQGIANLNLAIFTYVHFRTGEAVPNITFLEPQAENQKYTILVA